jgi:hypothetical protein
VGYRSKNIVGKKYFTNKDMLAGNLPHHQVRFLEEIGQLQWSYEVAVQMLSHFEDTSRQSLLEKLF